MLWRGLVDSSSPCKILQELELFICMFECCKRGLVGSSFPESGFGKSLRALDLLTHPLLVQDFVKSLNALYLHVRWM